MPELVLEFEDDVFEELKARAEAQGKSVAEMIGEWLEEEFGGVVTDAEVIRS
jgi:hypothetical protein